MRPRAEAPAPSGGGAGAPFGPGTVVFTDLDGTLLDARSYRFDAAAPALAELRRRGIPLVLCSSKTRAEIEVYRRRLDNREPFVFENGGGIGIPRGRFPFPVEGEAAGDLVVVSLGTPYRELRRVLAELRTALGVQVTGFGDLTAAGVAALTGLPPDEAELARRREFDEPFVFEDPGEPRAPEFLRAVAARGLRWTRGRFHHLLGDNDKGRAVRLLAGLYRRVLPGLRTVGVGDAPNDRTLLEAVDVPVLVQRADGTHDPEVGIPGLRLADAPGPRGWNHAVTELLGP